LDVSTDALYEAEIGWFGRRLGIEPYYQSPLPD
jgi:hypothetical protein